MIKCISFSLSLALHCPPSSTFFSDFSPPQGLPSPLSVFFSLYYLSIRLLITDRSAVLFLQLLFLFFLLFSLASVCSENSCTSWPPLHWGFSASHMWPAWVSILCALSVSKAPLIYGCSSKLTARFPPCLPLISGIIANKCG